MPRQETPSSPTQSDSQDPGVGLQGVIPSRWTPNTEPSVEDSQVEEDILAPPSPTPAQQRLSPIASTRLLSSYHRASTPSSAASNTFPSSADRVVEYERRIAHLEGEVHALRYNRETPPTSCLPNTDLCATSLWFPNERETRNIYALRAAELIPGILRWKVLYKPPTLLKSPSSFSSHKLHHRLPIHTIIMTIILPKTESMDQRLTQRSASPTTTTTTTMVTRSKTGKTANRPRRYDPNPTPGPSTQPSSTSMSSRTQSRRATASEELDAPLPNVFSNHTAQAKRKSTIKELKKDVEKLTKENDRLHGLNNRLQGQYQSLQWAFEMHVEKL
ncbi:hypothetical protein BDN72DRAFT_904118 [Pluteus cervinus]|uniref:Uncharacterized protein n=1 Tax=Pluteus cervinus TaxID=181527 RepID=A0ACD3A6V6_9AGAR|nr:hypothetical protein BDN72DRAFT_904118 [Pluteus cervinus]